MWKYLQSGCIGRECCLGHVWVTSEDSLPGNCGLNLPVVIFVLTNSNHWILFYTGVHNLRHSYKLSFFDPLGHHPKDYGSTISRYFDENSGLITSNICYQASQGTSAYYCLFFTLRIFNVDPISLGRLLYELNSKSESDIMKEVQGYSWPANLFETLPLMGPFQRIDLGIKHLLSLKLRDHEQEQLEEEERMRQQIYSTEDVESVEVNYEEVPFEMFL